MKMPSKNGTQSRDPTNQAGQIPIRTMQFDAAYSSKRYSGQPFALCRGFLTSIIVILDLDLVCPHYSVFCRRAKGLQIPLRRLLKPGEKLNVIFDSTEGLLVSFLPKAEQWEILKMVYPETRSQKIYFAIRNQSCDFPAVEKETLALRDFLYQTMTIFGERHFIE